jgi:methylmalonyl-CoA mutase cobalamin-binding domain/chain
MIIIGGVVPPQDYDALYKAGAEAIFPPGTGDLGRRGRTDPQAQRPPRA